MKNPEEVEDKNKILWDEINRLRKIRDEKIQELLTTSNKSILYLKQIIEEVEKMKKVYEEVDKMTQSKFGVDTNG